MGATTCTATTTYPGGHHGHHVHRPKHTCSLPLGSHAHGPAAPTGGLGVLATHLPAPPMPQAAVHPAWNHITRDYLGQHVRNKATSIHA